MFMNVRPLLWKVMLAVGASESALRRLCEQATQEQLILLHQRFRDAVAELVSTPGFTARAGSRSWELGAWIVAQGKRAWFNAKRDPGAAPAVPPDGAPDLARVMADVYRERFGTDIPAREPEPSAPPPEPDSGWETELWEVIDMLNAGIPPDDALASYTRSELQALDNTLLDVVGRVAEKAEAVFGDDPDGHSWSEWADWAVGQGRETCDGFLAHPRTAPRAIRGDAPFVDTLIGEEYRRRYGKLP